MGRGSASGRVSDYYKKRTTANKQKKVNRKQAIAGSKARGKKQRRG